LDSAPSERSGYRYISIWGLHETPTDRETDNPRGLHFACDWGRLCQWLGRGPAKVVDVARDLGLTSYSNWRKVTFGAATSATTRKMFVSSMFAELGK